MVFILADDLGYGDLGSYGHPYAITPNIDRLAEEGISLMQFYAAGATCIPSRAGFMTGIFPARFAKYPGDFGLGDQPTVTALLGEAGYRTGHFGKWHLGTDTRPGTYGIETIDAQNSDGRGARKGTRGRDSATFDRALGFIEKNRDERFYVQIWGHVPHFPANPDASFMRPFKSIEVNIEDFSPFMREKLEFARSLGSNIDTEMHRYLGAVYSLDQDVGRLLKKIDELGLRRNTLVIFTSDNGPSPVSAADPEGGAFEKYRLSMLGSTGRLRGEKGAFYEGGVRVPFIARWPGKVPAGHIDETSVTGAVDWLPTICSVTRTNCSTEAVDGEDVSSAWMGRGHERRRPLLWKQSWTNSPISIRWGRWKLHQGRPPARSIALYDVVRDPSEDNNLASEHPAIVEDLDERIRSWGKTLPRRYWRGPVVGTK